MKILHVIPTLSPSAGGPTEVALHLVRELNALGAQAEILTTDDDGPKRFNVPLGMVTEFKGVPVRFFPRINPRLKEFIVSPQAVGWLKNNIQAYDILDIHYLFSFVPLMARRLARRNGIQYTVRTMGQLSPWALQQSKIKKQIFFKLQELKNLQCADALHSTSKAEEDDIRAFGLRNRVINLPLGVTRPERIMNAHQLLRSKYNIAQGSFVLLFLSRLHHKKRPELVINVVQELSSSHNIHLIIAGSGDRDYENQLKEMVWARKMNGIVSFAGFVSGFDKDLLLQGSDLFILPSYSENFGIAVAEAIAAGTPVLISPEVQIAQYVYEYKAGIIAPGDKESITKEIRSFIQSPNTIMEYRAGGLKLVEERFEWRKIARELLSEYNELLYTHRKLK